MKIHDTLLGLLFACIGLAVLATVSAYPSMAGQDVGPALFPGVAAALLVVFGLTLALGRPARHSGRRLVVLGDWTQSPRHVVAGLSVVIGCAVYALFSTTLGFLVLAPIALLVWHLAFGVGLKTSILSALLATLCFWAIFYKGLGVPLPWGMLKNFAF